MGEMLIDMVQESGDRKLFEAHPGGAPANVAVGIARLGGKAAFMGKVGNDRLGEFLVDTLKKNDVNVKGLKCDGRTGIALISLDDKGERSFDFYEKLTTYNESDISEEVLDQTLIFHFGSISLIREPERLATIKCIKLAKERGAVISYDPNLRMNLWETPNLAREGMRLGLTYADILKIAHEELEFITGETDIEAGINKLLEANHGLKLITVTCGAKGSFCWYSGKSKYIPAIKVDAIDTTGAGDGFMAGILYSILRNGGLREMKWDTVEEACKIAGIVGGITTTRRGAISALPDMEQVRAYLKN